jgi:serine phosphatase RsbU (regulator of sigma subunit)
MARERRRGLRLRRITAVALLIALAATAGATWATYSIVHDQEKRLLAERAPELNLVLSSSIDSLSTGLATDGAILQATDGSRQAFEQAAQREVAAGAPSKVALAWFKRTAHGYVVLASAGDTLHNGEVISDVRVTTLDQAMDQTKMVVTPVFGVRRMLGFALGPPAAPPGTVLYREQPLGPLQAPPAASTAPFHELQIAIYDAPTPDPRKVLTTTTRDLPMRGDVVNVPLPAGATRWLTSVKAKQPLVGSAARDAWWIALLAGIIGSLLVAAIIDAILRRRDAAVALYETEHRVAETLQRSLLPRLPRFPGVELAARYFAGGEGQQVGGDWFDAFPIGDGRLAVAVGDVIGHDLAAASAMAQIRAALRAFAIDGSPPSYVVNRLDHLVDALGLTQLVTVVYAVIDAPDADGRRLLSFTNAGHLPPLLRDPSGAVATIESHDSVVIGAPIAVQHGQTELRLEPGSMLLMFTDGLVEVPGESLEGAIEALASTVAAHDPDAGLEDLCDRVLEAATHRELRDDIALLAIKVGSRDALTSVDTPDLENDYVT